MTIAGSDPVTIKCYSCDYLKDWNHGQGLTSCLDPFVPDNIPTVDCTGPCAVSGQTKTWHRSFTKIVNISCDEITDYRCLVRCVCYSFK